MTGAPGQDVVEGDGVDVTVGTSVQVGVLDAVGGGWVFAGTIGTAVDKGKVGFRDVDELAVGTIFGATTGCTTGAWIIGTSGVKVNATAILVSTTVGVSV
jgi:hypothetical protein